MSEKKNFQLKNEEMESKKLDVDKLEQVNGGIIFEEDKKSKARIKTNLYSKPNFGNQMYL
jgi:hypothetical protein